MGTNYYVHENECHACGRHEEIHLGKSSGGWTFAFQYNGGRFYKTVVEMRNWMIGKQIFDEYGAKISQRAFWEMVKEKQENLAFSCKEDEKHPGHVILINGYRFIDCEFS